MNTSSYFGRARTDVAFRRDELARLRWQKRMTASVAILVVVLWGGYAIYGALRDRRWVDVDPWPALLVAAILYARADARQKRLVAMNP